MLDRRRPGTDLSLVGDGHVGYGDKIGRDYEGNVKNRLQRWLVPAWESATGVSGLELRGGQVLLVAVDVRVVAPIEAPQPVVELALERDVQTGPALANGPAKPERYRLVTCVEGDVTRLQVLLPVHDQARGLNFDLRAVQGYLVGGLQDVDFNGLFAAEREVGEVWLQR